jgi:hypothetical protein
MSKSNKMETEILDLLFNGTAIPNIADNAASAPLTNLYVALHTGDPGEAGDQTTSEATYTSYARVAVARSGAGWTVINDTVNPAANIDFPQATGGSETITHWSIGKVVSGVGDIMYYGTVTPNIAVSSGVTPSLTTASTVTED